MGIVDKGVDNIFEILFSKDKTRLYLLFLVIIGFIIRVIAALNLDVHADDVGHAVYAIGFLDSGKLEIYHQSASLWHLVTDIFYTIFGITQFGSRFAAVLFGTFTIIIIFLLTYEFFRDKRISLIAALLATLSPFLIKNTLAEQDIMTMFFVLSGIYLFILGFKENKTKLIAYSGILIGLGIMTKLYVFFFIPGIYIYATYLTKKNTGEIINKNLIKKLLLFTLLAFIFFLPAVIHNYLLYQDKGILDFQFTRVFGLGEERAAKFYSWDAGWGAKADFKGFFLGNSIQLPWSTWPSSIWALTFILYNDPLVFILGFFGLILLFNRNREYVIFFLSFVFIPFFYLASIILLSKHYIFLLVFLIPSAAFSLDLIFKKIKGAVKVKYIVIALFLFYIIFLGFKIPHTHNHFYVESAIGELMDFKEKNIEDYSLVVADGRIYRGTFTWALNDKYYLESNYLSEILNNQDKLPGEVVDIPVYYIECVVDDCGWGTIKDQPEFNKTMEDITSFFKLKSIEVKTIKNKDNSKYYFPFFKQNKGEDYYRIYKTTFRLKSTTLDFAYSTHKWWLYPVGYDERISPIYDNYNKYQFLHKFARLIQYMAITLIIISIISLLVILVKRE